MMLESVALICPHCWERIEIEVDASAIPARYVEDCGVCCRPIVVTAAIDANGQLDIDAERESD